MTMTIVQVWVLGLTLIRFPVEASPSSVEHPKWRLAAVEVGAGTDLTEADVLGFADSATADMDELERRLVVANWMMAREVEPFASRLLLGISERDDADAAARIMAKAGEQLGRAQGIWARLAAEADDDADQRREISEDLKDLLAFAGALRAVWPADSPEEVFDADPVQQAASDLAILLEDDREDVAAAALLWQAHLYGSNGQFARALDLLPAAMKPVEEGDVYGFFARLARCRYMVGAHQGHVAGFALLARIEERCADWFEPPAQQLQARCAAGLVRRQVTREWADLLEQAGKPQRVAWCDGAIARIDREYFSDGGSGDLLRLGLAIPAIVDLAPVDKSRGVAETGTTAPSNEAHDATTAGIMPPTTQPNE